MNLGSKKKLLFISLPLVACGLLLSSFYFLKNKHTVAKQEVVANAPAQAKNDSIAKFTKPLKLSSDIIKPVHGVLVPILMYHHVGDAPLKANATRLDLTVTTADFEQQVAWLKQEGYESISLENLYQYSQNKFALPKKPIIFTFDDGYQDVFTNAVPILDKYGFKGSFAIITNNPGTTQGDNVYASWDEIAKSVNDGQEIVSHTQDHFDGSSVKYSSDFITQNLNGSITDIKNHLGITTNILIYPYGHYTPEYLKIAQKAGFVMGLTVHGGETIDLNNLMQVPRVRVHGSEEMQKFEDILLGKITLAMKTGK